MVPTEDLNPRPANRKSIALPVVPPLRLWSLGLCVEWCLRIVGGTFNAVHLGLTCIHFEYEHIFNALWHKYFEAKALVPGASNKLSEWLIEWVIEYAIFLHVLAQQWRPPKKRNLVQKLPTWWGWCPNFEYMHSAEKARDTTLDDEKYDVRYTWRRKLECPLQRPIPNRSSVLVMVLCNTFASDLDDDQSRYLFKWWWNKLWQWIICSSAGWAFYISWSNAVCVSNTSNEPWSRAENQDSLT